MRSAENCVWKAPTNMIAPLCLPKDMWTDSAGTHVCIHIARTECVLACVKWCFELLWMCFWSVREIFFYCATDENKNCKMCKNDSDSSMRAHAGTVGQSCANIYYNFLTRKTLVLQLADTLKALGAINFQNYLNIQEIRILIENMFKSFHHCGKDNLIH